MTTTTTTTTTTGTDLETLHAELEQEVIRLKLELAEAKTLNAHTTKERDDATNELAEAVQANIRVMRERDELRAELEDARSQIDDLAVEITNLRFNSFKLSHDVDIFQKENDELERRNRYLEEHQSDSQIGLRSSSGVGDDMVSIAEEQTLCSDGSSSSSLHRKDGTHDSHGSNRSLTSRQSGGGGGGGGDARPSFGKIESSSKLMNSYTALEIFSAIEDGCLDGGHGAPSEPIRRLSHQTCRRSSELSEGVPTKHI